MARGRIIANDITKDKRVNDLSDDTSRLAFTWLVTFADCEGRTHGDPALVRSTLFPRRDDITNEQMESYIKEWAAAGLVVWYQSNGDKWIQFPAFAKHQKGFDKRHEPDSVHPPPPDVPGNVQDGCTEVVRTLPVQCTAEVKRSEVNRNEDAGQKQPAPSMPTVPNKPTAGEKKPGAKTEMMNVFLEVTNMTMPTRQSTIGFWWSSIGELYEICGKDAGAGKRLIRDTVAQMQSGDRPLTIAQPKSIINPARALWADSNAGKANIR